MEATGEVAETKSILEHVIDVRACMSMYNLQLCWNAYVHTYLIPRHCRELSRFFFFLRASDYAS